MQYLILVLLLIAPLATASAAPWDEHGPLRVSANGHYIEHADGAGFFWLGDTAWYLNRIPPADVEIYLRDRAAKGFTVIQIKASADRPNYAGELPFLGEGPPWKEVRFNEAYWKHNDFIVAKARERGLYVAIWAWWGSNAEAPVAQPGKQGVGTVTDPDGQRWRYSHASNGNQYFSDTERDNFAFGKALAERYKNEPHIIWCGSGEYQQPYYEPMPPRHMRAQQRLIDGLLAGDEGRHLVSMHPNGERTSSEDYHDAPWLAFNMIQTHTAQNLISRIVSGDWTRTPAKPTLNSEGWYEGEPFNEHRYGMKVIQPFRHDWIQRYQAYWSVFYGSIGYTYGHRNFWTMTPLGTELTPGWWKPFPGKLERTVLDAPGVHDLRHVRTLMESKPIQSRVPDQELLTANSRGQDATLAPDLRCATRDENGKWAFVYSTRGAPMHVVMSRLAKGKAQAFWFNPRTGGWGEEAGGEKKPFQAAIASGPGADAAFFLPPGEPADGNDWVLVLEVN